MSAYWTLFLQAQPRPPVLPAMPVDPELGCIHCQRMRERLKNADMADGSGWRCACGQTYWKDGGWMIHKIGSRRKDDIRA